ncbi:hypothetical protein Chor_005764 [Crotalus horridus]
MAGVVVVVVVVVVVRQVSELRQFLQFKLKVVPVELKRFEDRVEFTGNPRKNDVSFTLHNVQLEDAGLYNCYVMNPPDRQKGHGQISLKVLTEVFWKRAKRPFLLLVLLLLGVDPWCCALPDTGLLSTELPERDSTVAVIVGATVGGFLAVVILALVIVKCVRRKKQQRLNTDDQKTEEEGKTDGEGNPEEGMK